MVRNVTAIHIFHKPTSPQSTRYLTFNLLLSFISVHGGDGTVPRNGEIWMGDRGLEKEERGLWSLLAFLLGFLLIPDEHLHSSELLSSRWYVITIA